MNIIYFTNHCFLIKLLIFFIFVLFTKLFYLYKLQSNIIILHSFPLLQRKNKISHKRLVIALPIEFEIIIISMIISHS